MTKIDRPNFSSDERVTAKAVRVPTTVTLVMPNTAVPVMVHAEKSKKLVGWISIRGIKDIVLFDHLEPCEVFIEDVRKLKEVKSDDQLVSAIEACNYLDSYGEITWWTVWVIHYTKCIVW